MGVPIYQYRIAVNFDPLYPLFTDRDDDGDVYSATLASRETIGNKRMGVSEMA
jgi:hypothetical protein